jgi:TonB family protein
MNPYTAVATLLTLSLFWFQPVQKPWEQRVVDDTKKTLASDLDAELPRLSFAEWFGTVVGADAGVVWQLSECGDKVEEAPNQTSDLRACVEANTILTDGRRVIVMIAVGTFKKGMTSSPAFHFGVIERNGELRAVPRLRDLRNLVLKPEKALNRPVVVLPELNKLSSIALKPGSDYVAAPLAQSGEDFNHLPPIEDPEPPPRPKPNRTESGLRQGAPIEAKKVQPAYPRNNGAKRFNASGIVEVQLSISRTGRVTAAKAIKGHPLLRQAAVEAALQWEFEPTIMDGAPIDTQLIISFTFAVPPQ